MNSSTGFKKRNLLRPPSGLISHTREFLKIIDISQSEPILASNIRTEVAAVQEQINLLDKDKAIRAGESSLEKSSNLNIRKWLREVQGMNEKEDDDMKILKQMGVDNYEGGFRKLWKLICHLDLITTKVTELQAVQFLKYDKHFENITTHSANGQRILQNIGKGGFNPNSFYLSQLLLTRELELFEATSELKRNGTNTSVAGSSKGFMKTKSQSDDLVEQLKRENKKLMELLGELQENQKKQAELEKQKREREQKQNQIETKPVAIVTAASESTLSSEPREAFVQLEEKYNEQISSLNNRIDKLENELGQVKIHCSSLEVQLKHAQNQLKSEDFKSRDKPKAGSYEEALMEEMNKMKAGFERKIKTVLEELSTKEREMRRRQSDYRNENERIKWERGLLMKKYEILANA